MKNNYIIIGASSGIGAACTRILSESAEHMILVGRDNDRLTEVASDCDATTYTCTYDLNDLDHIKDIFAMCREERFKLDGMVYSAGVNADCPIKANQISLMKEAMTVNCFAFIEAGKYFYSRSISNDGAAIVAISSISSLICEKGMAPYSASKAALNSAVKTMSKEFSRRHIRVNAILPAAVDTPMARRKMEVLESINNDSTLNTHSSEDRQYMGLIPDNVIAQNVEFLLSENSRYMTGELMTIGAGLSY